MQTFNFAALLIMKWLVFFLNNYKSISMAPTLNNEVIVRRYIQSGGKQVGLKNRMSKVSGDEADVG